MNIIIVIIIVVGIFIIFYKRERHEKNRKEVLITSSFGSLEKGRTAIFRSGLQIEMNDYVLIHLPGYETIWRVVKINGNKIELENQKGEVLKDFPVCHVWGKLIQC